ncbi:hypothetical protein [Gemmata sp.]|uniref:hypothetical protein n=1 Tax=Gemmata sp. TaxID=1914242 RepID=UPI003F71F00B
MTEHEWLTCTDPAPMLEFLRAKASNRKLRLFGVACCRRVWESMSEEGSRSMVLVAERFADGLATADELQVASVQAKAADDNIYLKGGNQYTSTAVCGLGINLDLGSVMPNVFSSITLIGDEELLAVCEDEAKFGALMARREADEWRTQSLLLRDIFGNPFRSVAIDPAWRTSTVVALAEGIYAERAFDRMPILADALQDAGCDSDDVLNHCRSNGPHCRGCWVVDLILGKE